jgi:hypothetical protein
MKNSHSAEEIFKVAIIITNRVVRTEGMMTAPVDNEIVILNMKGNNYISLDATGRRIWELLEKPVGIAELCYQLMTEFEATEEQITGDVLPFLQELEREGLVRTVD